MFRSIRLRIAIPYVLLIVIIMVGLGVYFSRYLEQNYLSTLEEELISQARLASVELAPRIVAGEDAAQIDQTARQWGSTLDKRVTIIAKDGTVIGESEFNRLEMENHANRPEVIRAGMAGKGTEIRYSDTLGVDMMYAAAPIQSNGEIIGYARVAMPLSSVQDSLRRLQNTLAVVTVIVSLLAVALAVEIAGRTTRPLRQLAEAAEEVSQGQRGSHLIPSSQDEVGQLTVKFNEMTTQIDAQIAALNAERSRMSAVLEEMSDGVLIVDEDGKVQLANRAAESIFTMPAAQMAGRSMIELLRHHQIHELWDVCRRTGDTVSGTVEITGRRLYLQCTAKPLGHALPGNILLLFQNLTQLKRLETVRQDFVSNISHELRTPLASLKALTETLMDGALEDPPAARSFLARMDTEVDALTQMVEELLELTRIESGRVPLRLAPTSPAHLLNAAVKRLEVQAERAGLEVIVDCPADLPAVLADERRLEQVVVNLLHNAIKFTPAGGQITLRARQEEGSVRFEVSDTGVGIPADDLPRIFERFFKTDRARTTGGTGLGLAIVRHLVEAHAGKIQAESVEGKGSSFHFTIPTAV